MSTSASASKKGDKASDTAVEGISASLESAKLGGDGVVAGAGAASSESAANAEMMAKVAEANELLHAIKQPTLEDAIASASRSATTADKADSKSDKQALLASLVGKKATDSAATTKSHRFWDTQPVPKLDETVEAHGPIDPPKTVDEIMKEPYPLPGGYEWVSLDVTNEAQLDEMYVLLRDHYVEDDENMFRFNYSKEFLRWALTPPHYYPHWHVGVRKTKTGTLVACITGIPANMQIYHNTMVLCEINFLCVHKSLRSKRLAPVLIKEVTRRVNLEGIFQAAYTAGVVLPKPVSSCQYWHRSINPKKLIEVGFSRLAPRMTMTRTQRLYDLPSTPKIPGIRQLKVADVPAVTKLLNAYLAKFPLHPIYTEEEFHHWMVPREGVIDSFVVEHPTTHEITDFLSFYHLPSTIIGHDKHKMLYAVYSYYNVCNTHSLKEIMEDALILAKTKGIDVFNALDLMENAEVVKELKFGPGDGHLQYYLYNWQCPSMPPSGVGLVLL